MFWDCPKRIGFEKDVNGLNRPLVHQLPVGLTLLIAGGDRLTYIRSTNVPVPNPPPQHMLTGP